ncbi:MAG: GumC family protein [Candidatus Methylomirabilales bacterium]
MVQYDINLREYLRIIRRRRGIVILVPLLFGLSAFALTLLQAPTPLYHATAVVRVERAVSMAGFLQEVLSFDPESNLDTQAALIKGFPVMSLTAKKLGLIPQGATPEEIRASPAYMKAIQTVEAHIEVERVQDTSLIEINATSANPKEASRIANSTAAAFQEDNLATRSRHVREARKFIEGQLQEIGSRLKQSEERLGTFQEKNEIILLSEETRAVLNRTVALEADLEKTRRAVAETKDQLKLLKEGKELGRPIGLVSDAPDPTLAKIYASLSELILQRENLLLTLHPTHPQVKQVDAETANIRQSLRRALTSRLQALQGRAAELRKGITRLKKEQAAMPETALELARKEREVAVNERIYSLLKERYQEALIKEKEQVAEVSLVRPATVPAEPINPPAAMSKAAVGLVIGLIMGGVLAFVVETMDTSIGAIDEVESLLQTSVLGVVPHLDVEAELAEEKGEAVSLDQETKEKYTMLLGLFLPKARVVEAFRALRTNLYFSGLERNLKTLMITSSTQMEGKTTVAINLAIALAQLGKRTLLVEADLRNPFLHHAFGIPKEPGLAEVVIGSVPLDEAVRSFPDLILGRAGIEGLIDRPGIDNLFLLPCGDQPQNPSEFLSAQGMADFMAKVRRRYDYVVFDAAPILPVADSSILGAHVDGTLMTVRVGRVARAALRRAKALLEGARAHVLGVCLTGVRADVSPDYAEMAYYRYRYGARKETPTPSVRMWGLLGGELKRMLKIITPQARR